MTEKTKQLIEEITECLFENKAVLLTGTSGVGKTFVAKQVVNRLCLREYSCHPESSEQSVQTEIVSCHSGISYEDLVIGITPITEGGKMLFEYKEKTIVRFLAKAARDNSIGSGTKYVLLLDDIQRCEISDLLGDAVSIIGAKGDKRSIHLNSGATIEVPPNFYIIGTYNPHEDGAVELNNQILGRFYTREILSDINYITEDTQSESARIYNQVRALVVNNLDIQHKTSAYEQKRYILGHGYFAENNILMRIKHQVIPLLQQYISEGILDSQAEKGIALLKSDCEKNRRNRNRQLEKSCFSDYRSNITASVFINDDGLDMNRPRNSKPSIPVENLVGRIIDQRLLSNEEIKQNILFNSDVCYREVLNTGVLYQAQLIATSLQYEKIRRGGSDGRKLYNGGTIIIDGSEHHFTGGMQPKEYTIRNPRQGNSEIWNIGGKYEIGESTSPNAILYRIIWQYYKTLIDGLGVYISNVPDDQGKERLLRYIRHEWDGFLKAFKEITPKPDSDPNKKAINNQEANKQVRELIGRLTILWSNLGDTIELEDGTVIVVEGVDNEMSESIYNEYKATMDSLGIKQMILQGPPGTSKTYSAKQFLKYVANCTDSQLADLQIVDYSQKDKYCGKLFKGKGTPDIAWDIVQFHPSYGYEDFIRGIKVTTKAGTDSIMYETVNKVLGSMAELAKDPKNKGTSFYLIIDEINRANLAAVFGELIYGLEYRSESVSTPYTVNNSNRIEIPDNIYIIGTMNTADKSIGGIDYAIRRRFLFFEQLPDKNVIRSYGIDRSKGQTLIGMENTSKQEQLNEKAIKLFECVERVFTEGYMSPEYRREDVQIGHTYFLVNNEEQLLRRFEYQIIPILKEYYRDGIISFDIEESTTGFDGFLNCISGNINIASQREVVERIFRDLIV